MTYTGTVKNGVVILPPEVELPEGAEVDVTPRLSLPIAGTEQKVSTLGELARQLAKPRSHLPADYALNHGHYVRGEPRK